MIWLMLIPYAVVGALIGGLGRRGMPTWYSLLCMAVTTVFGATIIWVNSR